MKQLTIFETSDIHGYFYPTNYQHLHENTAFGLFKLAEIYKKEAGKLSGPSLLIDNGDVIQGSPLSYYVLKEYQDAKPLMEAMNELPYDAGVIGNHEFNYGAEYLKTAVEAADYPILSANILNNKKKPAFGKPYRIIEKEGLKIGILGLTTPYIPHWEHPKNYEGLEFMSAFEAAKEYLPALRKEADVLVVSYHGGFERDIHTNEITENQTGENEGWKLLKETDGIDVLLTGHQHNRHAAVVNGTAVLMPGQKGEHLGKVTLDLEKEDGRWKVIQAYPELIPVSEETKTNEKMSEKYAPLNKKVNGWLDQPIGRIRGDMRIKDIHQARIEEHPYTEFVQKVQMHFSGCSISGTALFSNDIQGFGSQVTMRDIVTNYIYPNTLSVLEVSGADLKAAIEQSAEYFTLNEEGEITVSGNYLTPKPKMYNYDMYEGVDYVIDVARPIGERVVLFQKDGRDIKPSDILTIVINHYRAVGGGNFRMFDSSKIIREVTVSMTELMTDYFQTYPEVQAEVNHNFTVINSNKSE